MQIEAIYGLVHQDLQEVEQKLKLLVESQQDRFPELYQMLKQILIGGKIIRPTLTLLAGRFYEYDREKLLPMATASELLHIATLVHDDAIDKADMRRSRETVNKLWGLERAVILGDFLFAMAGRFATDTGNLRAVNLFTQTLENISRGELRQGFSAFKLEQTYESYIERIAGKTAALFAMATESGAVLSQAPEESVQGLKRYGYNLGITFQIVDDILDFVSTEKEMGKPVASDLAQGTVTLPSLLLMQKYPQENPVRRLFKNEGSKQQNIEKAVEMVRDCGFIDESYRIAGEYKTEACRNLEELPDNPSRQALLALADYIVGRRK